MHRRIQMSFFVAAALVGIAAAPGALARSGHSAEKKVAKQAPACGECDGRQPSSDPTSGSLARTIAAVNDVEMKSTSEEDAVRDKFKDLVNQERVKHGLKALVSSQDLDDLSRTQCERAM